MVNAVIIVVKNAVLYNDMQVLFDVKSFGLVK
jgi:hypothetical protein